MAGGYGNAILGESRGRMRLYVAFRRTKVLWNGLRTHGLVSQSVEAGVEVSSISKSSLATRRAADDGRAFRTLRLRC